MCNLKSKTECKLQKIKITKAHFSQEKNETKKIGRQNKKKKEKSQPVQIHDVTACIEKL